MGKNGLTKRDLQAQATRNKLMETGKKIVNERGYGDITVDEITEQCGVSKGTFYHYFDSKEAFFDLIAYQPYVELDKSITDWGLGLEESVVRYMREYMELVMSYSPQYLTTWLGHLTTRDSVGSSSTGEMHEIDYALQRTDDLAAFLDGFVTNGELAPDCPTRKLAQMIISLGYGNIVWYCMSHEELDITEITTANMEEIVSVLRLYRTDRAACLE